MARGVNEFGQLLDRLVWQRSLTYCIKVFFEMSALLVCIFSSESVGAGRLFRRLLGVFVGETEGGQSAAGEGESPQTTVEKAEAETNHTDSSTGSTCTAGMHIRYSMNEWMNE